MNDIDVRRALRAGVLVRYVAAPGARVVEELDVCRCRIDVAAVEGGALHGWEIKSDRDTLTRLPAQVLDYGRVFRHLTLVAGAAHLEAALEIVPAWWGVLRATTQDGTVALERVREGAPNPAPEPYAVASLLWRDEVMQVLRDFGLARGLSKANRRTLYQALAREVPLLALEHVVTATLVARRDWRT